MAARRFFVGFVALVAVVSGIALAVVWNERGASWVRPILCFLGGAFVIGVPVGTLAGYTLMPIGRAIIRLLPSLADWRSKNGPPSEVL